jgi:hypothetical protein
MVVLREEARNSPGFGVERFTKTRSETEQAQVWKGRENLGFPVSPQPSLDGDRRQVGIDSDVNVYQIIERKRFHLVFACFEK